MISIMYNDSTDIGFNQYCFLFFLVSSTTHILHPHPQIRKGQVIVNDQNISQRDDLPGQSSGFRYPQSQRALLQTTTAIDKDEVGMMTP